MKIYVGPSYVKLTTDLICTCAHFNNQSSHHVGRGSCSSTSTWESVAVQILWPRCWCCRCVLGLGTTYTSPVQAGQMQQLVPALLLFLPLAGRCLTDLSHMCCLDPSTPLCRGKKTNPSNWFINPTSESCMTTFGSDTVEPLVLLWRWTRPWCEWSQIVHTNWILLPY